MRRLWTHRLRQEIVPTLIVLAMLIAMGIIGAVAIYLLSYLED